MRANGGWGVRPLPFRAEEEIRHLCSGGGLAPEPRVTVHIDGPCRSHPLSNAPNASGTRRGRPPTPSGHTVATNAFPGPTGTDQGPCPEGGGPHDVTPCHTYGTPSPCELSPGDGPSRRELRHRRGTCGRAPRGVPSGDSVGNVRVPCGNATPAAPSHCHAGPRGWDVGSVPVVTATALW